METQAVEADAGKGRGAGSGTETPSDAWTPSDKEDQPKIMAIVEEFLQKAMDMYSGKGVYTAPGEGVAATAPGQAYAGSGKVISPDGGAIAEGVATPSALPQADDPASTNMPPSTTAEQPRPSTSYSYTNLPKEYIYAKSFDPQSSAAAAHTGSPRASPRSGFAAKAQSKHRHTRSSMGASSTHVLPSTAEYIYAKSFDSQSSAAHTGSPQYIYAKSFDSQSSAAHTGSPRASPCSGFAAKAQSKHQHTRSTMETSPTHGSSFDPPGSMNDRQDSPPLGPLHRHQPHHPNQFHAPQSKHSRKPSWPSAPNTGAPPATGAPYSTSHQHATPTRTAYPTSSAFPPSSNPTSSGVNHSTGTRPTYPSTSHSRNPSSSSSFSYTSNGSFNQSLSAGLNSAAQGAAGLAGRLRVFGKKAVQAAKGGLQHLETALDKNLPAPGDYLAPLYRKQRSMDKPPASHFDRAQPTPSARPPASHFDRAHPSPSGHRVQSPLSTGLNEFPSRKPAPWLSATPGGVAPQANAAGGYDSGSIPGGVAPQANAVPGGVAPPANAAWGYDSGSIPGGVASQSSTVQGGVAPTANAAGGYEDEPIPGAVAPQTNAASGFEDGTEDGEGSEAVSIALHLMELPPELWSETLESLDLPLRMEELSSGDPTRVNPQNYPDIPYQDLSSGDPTRVNPQNYPDIPYQDLSSGDPTRVTPQNYPDIPYQPISSEEPNGRTPQYYPDIPQYNLPAPQYDPIPPQCDPLPPQYDPLPPQYDPIPPRYDPPPPQHDPIPPQYDPLLPQCDPIASPCNPDAHQSMGNQSGEAEPLDSWKHVSDPMRATTWHAYPDPKQATHAGYPGTGHAYPDPGQASYTGYPDTGHANPDPGHASYAGYPGTGHANPDLGQASHAGYPDSGHASNPDSGHASYAGYPGTGHANPDPGQASYAGYPDTGHAYPDPGQASYAGYPGTGHANPDSGHASSPDLGQASHAGYPGTGHANPDLVQTSHADYPDTGHAYPDPGQASYAGYPGTGHAYPDPMQATVGHISNPMQPTEAEAETERTATGSVADLHSGENLFHADPTTAASLHNAFPSDWNSIPPASATLSPHNPFFTDQNASATASATTPACVPPNNTSYTENNGSAAASATATPDSINPFPSSNAASATDLSGGLAPEHIAASLAPEHRAASLAPDHKAASQAPEHRAASQAPEYRAASQAPEHRAASQAPEHRAASQAPEHRAASLAPEHRVASPVAPAVEKVDNKARQERARQVEQETRLRAAAEEKKAKEAEAARFMGEVALAQEKCRSKIAGWESRYKGNIRSLLATLHTVLWANSGWAKVTVGQILEPSQTKKAYMKSNLLVHPDKVNQFNSTPLKYAMASLIFNAQGAGSGKVAVPVNLSRPRATLCSQQRQAQETPAALTDRVSWASRKPLSQTFQRDLPPSNISARKPAPRVGPRPARRHDFVFGPQPTPPCPLVLLHVFPLASFALLIPSHSSRCAATPRSAWLIPAGSTILLTGDVSTPYGIIVRGTLLFDYTSTTKLQASFLAVEGSGGLRIGSEACPLTSKAEIYLTGSAKHGTIGGKSLGVMGSGALELHGAKGLADSWTRLGASAGAGSDVIQVANPVGWSVGDSVVIASTDYDPYQNEQRTITQVLSPTSFRLDRPLFYLHYGLITEGVDARAEVGLLTRNILVHALMEGCSIHQSEFRAITIHGTQGALVANNVGYNVKGHMYFLEDGSEFDNTFASNLGIETRAKLDGERVGSDGDSGISTYWITNPANTFTGNVAAGSESVGFWVHTRLGVRGHSKSSGLYNSIRPHVTPLGLFQGNRAHSLKQCVEFEADAFSDDVPSLGSEDSLQGGEPGGAPRDDAQKLTANWGPRNAFNQEVTTVVSQLVCARAYRVGSWTRMRGLSYVDTVWMIRPIFVGLSSNPGHPISNAYQHWDAGLGRSMPNWGDYQWQGYKLYDGPAVLTNPTFINYPAFNHRGGTASMAAMGVRAHNVFIMNAGSTVRGAVFSNVAVRVDLNRDRVGAGGLTSSLWDADGSISGYPDSTLLPDLPFYWASACVASPVISLACPHRYANLVAVGQGGGDLHITRSTVAGPSHPGASHSLSLSPMNSIYMPIVAVGASYLLSFDSQTPSKVAVQLETAEQGLWVDLAVCFPPGVSVLGVRRGADASGANNEDPSRNIVLARIQQRNSFDGADRAVRDQCPPGGCDFIVFDTSSAGPGVSAQACQGQAYGISPSLQVNSGAWLQQQLPPPLFSLPTIPAPPPFSGGIVIPSPNPTEASPSPSYPSPSPTDPFPSPSDPSPSPADPSPSPTPSPSGGNSNHVYYLSCYIDTAERAFIQRLGDHTLQECAFHCKTRDFSQFALEYPQYAPPGKDGVCFCGAKEGVLGGDLHPKVQDTECQGKAGHTVDWDGTIYIHFGSDLRLAECAFHCKTRGFSHMALESSQGAPPDKDGDCFCGAKDRALGSPPFDRVLDSQCQPVVGKEVEWEGLIYTYFGVSSPPPPLSQPAPIYYLGCFIDTQERAFIQRLGYHTLQECAFHCKTRGFSHMALESSKGAPPDKDGDCFCGAKDGVLGSTPFDRLLDSQCQPVVGKEVEWEGLTYTHFGGDWQLAVYTFAPPN
eukprot:gene20062-26781_t